MKKNRLWTDKLKYFLLGVLTITGVVCLAGMSNSSAPSSPHYGRFQISAWGTAFGDFSGGYGAFIVDTATGETKTAYMYIYGKSNDKNKSISKDNLGKPFYEIK